MNQELLCHDATYRNLFSITITFAMLRKHAANFPRWFPVLLTMSLILGYSLLEIPRCPGRHPARFSKGTRDIVKFVMYNKPWKTGSTSMARRLKSCLTPLHYKLVDFEKHEGHHSIIPVSPVLRVSAHSNMFAVDHGLYNVAELQYIKDRVDVDACYLTSIRNPTSRVISNAVQIVSPQIVRPGGDNFFSGTTTGDVGALAGRVICQGIEKFEPQYMVHYMVGIRAGSMPNLTSHETKLLVGDVMSVYDIVLDEAGSILHDTRRPECSEARACLAKDNHIISNVKLGSIENPETSECQSRIDMIVEEENIFYNEMLRLIREWRPR
jgi:hypothetical protein